MFARRWMVSLARVYRKVSLGTGALDQDSVEPSATAFDSAHRRSATYAAQRSYESGFQFEDSVSDGFAPRDQGSPWRVPVQWSRRASSGVSICPNAFASPPNDRPLISEAVSWCHGPFPRSRNPCCGPGRKCRRDTRGEPPGRGNQASRRAPASRLSAIADPHSHSCRATPSFSCRRKSPAASRRAPSGLRC